MASHGQGRKRTPNRNGITPEEDALNVIAREAEAQLTAKRVARAEAREIRMKELERQQKEGSSRGPTLSTETSLSGASSSKGSGGSSVTADTETSLRDIKEIHELKDQVRDVEINYMQILKVTKDSLSEMEMKYRKAMVSNAQLDNEKSNLVYEDLEREKHAHSILHFQFSNQKETLKQSEELLSEIRQLHLKQEGFTREISDLQETVKWKDKKIGALEKQKEFSDAIRNERDELRDEVVQLKDTLKVTRLEGQMTRYKSAAVNAEKVEDELKAEKRKLQRELQSAFDKIEELEANNSHLNKRLEKIKAYGSTAASP
ncbi:Leucine-rich repeat flightless-interacting protein 2 [Bagarius yarrelli]|uniref:Leucine-rich repeat flightless-interacting protein 2 n=1 Tax=Bagarius yarrelli TaxID=175774 RepID=A0A556VB48_BAGYA|nr:Leucine-rich repeat flightless-interacting protein 2 [Bagarius yarrelli]